MNKFKGMLLCTDLDGTLLKKDKTVSQKNREAIEYFKSEGGLFTFITGRAAIFVGESYEPVKPNAPVGCLNGGAIYDFEKKKYLYTEPIGEDVLELVRYADEAMRDIDGTDALGIQLVTFDKTWFCRESYGLKRFRDITGAENLTADFDEVPRPLAKIIFSTADMNKMELLMTLLASHPRADDFSFIRSEKSLYEILPKGISKGTLLVKMAELFGIDMKNTVAVGDYNNDISMIKAAGLGVAVENAVPEAKAAADLVTSSNEDDAIAKIIEILDGQNG